MLESLLAAANDPLRVSPLLRAPSGQVVEAVCKLGLEGVVGKRIDSIYEPGERSGAWIKHGTNMEQEFVIGGYIPGARGFDALLVGVYENKEFIFVAKVKDGFVPRIRDEIFPALKALHDDEDLKPFWDWLGWIGVVLQRHPLSLKSRENPAENSRR